MIWLYTERRPLTTPTVNAPPRNWGSDWKAYVAQHADRHPNIYLQKTTLPYEGNFIDLDPVYKDAMGVPRPRITGTWRANEAAIGSYIQQKVALLFREAGASTVTIGAPVSTTAPMGSSTHAYGGSRMGTDPGNSVVDAYGFSHECPNVGMLGGSVMITSGCHNPTETIQALAWRTAEHLAKNWKSITH